MLRELWISSGPWLASPPWAASAIRLIGPVTDAGMVIVSVPEPAVQPLAAVSASAAPIASRSEQFELFMKASSVAVLTTMLFALALDANANEATAPTAAA